MNGLSNGQQATSTTDKATILFSRTLLIVCWFLFFFVFFFFLFIIGDHFSNIAGHLMKNFSGQRSRLMGRGTLCGRNELLERFTADKWEVLYIKHSNSDYSFGRWQRLFFMDYAIFSVDWQLVLKTH